MSSMGDFAVCLAARAKIRKILPGFHRTNYWWDYK
jgi:hypothetical protein